MTRINENRYEMNFGSSVGVIVDEYLMKKLAKLQYKHKMELLAILENNKDHYCDYSWSITDQPEDVDQSERVFDYIEHDKYTAINMESRLDDMFKIRKVQNLYESNINKWSEKIQELDKEHTHYLECRHILEDCEKV